MQTILATLRCASYTANLVLTNLDFKPMHFSMCFRLVSLWVCYLIIPFPSCVIEVGNGPRNPAPRNHFLVWTWLRIDKDLND